MCNHSYIQRLMQIKQAGRQDVQPFIHTKIDASMQFTRGIRDQYVRKRGEKREHRKS